VAVGFVRRGCTDYVAIISRFAADSVIGEMDGVYSSWATKAPVGFSDDQIATLKRLVPYLALAIKSVALARMTGTLMETYLGRDAGQRVLGGRFLRGVADRIDAVVWFSGLHVGDVFYGNVGGRERLDFTVIGPAVNEASRIAAMCRSVDQPVLMSSAFANVGVVKQRLVSVGRYALRGVAQPQELFTFEPGP